MSVFKDFRTSPLLSTNVSSVVVCCGVVKQRRWVWRVNLSLWYMTKHSRVRLPRGEQQGDQELRLQQDQHRPGWEGWRLAKSFTPDAQDRCKGGRPAVMLNYYQGRDKQHVRECNSLKLWGTYQLCLKAISYNSKKSISESNSALRVSLFPHGLARVSRMTSCVRAWASLFHLCAFTQHSSCSRVYTFAAIPTTDAYRKFKLILILRHIHNQTQT